MINLKYNTYLYRLLYILPINKQKEKDIIRYRIVIFTQNIKSQKIVDSPILKRYYLIKRREVLNKRKKYLL